jgi:hypothetical protein
MRTGRGIVTEQRQAEESEESWWRSADTVHPPWWSPPRCSSPAAGRAVAARTPPRRHLHRSAPPVDRSAPPSPRPECANLVASGQALVNTVIQFVGGKATGDQVRAAATQLPGTIDSARATVGPEANDHLDDAQAALQQLLTALGAQPPDFAARERSTGGAARGCDGLSAGHQHAIVGRMRPHALASLISGR